MIENQDVLLQPKLADMGTGDFSIINEKSIQVGYNEAEKYRSLLLKYQLTPKAYAKYQQVRQEKRRVMDQQT